MAKNDSRRLNIRVVGLAEDGDWAAGRVFRVMVTPLPEDDHKGRPRQAGESSPHPRTETGPEQETQVAAAMIPCVQRQAKGHGSDAPGEPGRWSNLQRIQDLFLQRFLLVVAAQTGRSCFLDVAYS